MAALPPVPNVLRVAISGTCDTFNWLNALHFGYSGGAPSPTDLETLCNGLGENWSATVTPLQDVHTILQTIEATDLTSSTSAQYTLEGIDLPGTRDGSFLPADACALIDYPINRRYRGGHPRTYLCVGVQGDLTDRAHWSTDFQTAVIDGWRDFITGAIGIMIGPATIESQGCVSYVSVAENPIPPNRRAVPIFEAFTPNNNSCSLELASQRRRIGRK